MSIPSFWAQTVLIALSTVSPDAKQTDTRSRIFGSSISACFPRFAISGLIQPASGSISPIPAKANEIANGRFSKTHTTAPNRNVSRAYAYLIL